MYRSIPTDPPDEPVNRLEPYLEKLAAAQAKKSLWDWIQEQGESLPAEYLEIRRDFESQTQGKELSEEEMRKLRREALRRLRELAQARKEDIPAEFREMMDQLKTEAWKKMASDPSFVLRFKESLRDLLLQGYPEECLEQAEEVQKRLASPDPEIEKIIAEARKKIEEGDGD